MIQRLIERDFAYVDRQGQVYFEVAKFPEYGRLSGKRLAELEVGARVAVRDEKRDPRDFALWKVDGRHLMQWDPHGPDGWPDGGQARLPRPVPGGVDARVARAFRAGTSSARRWLAPSSATPSTSTPAAEDNIFPHHECEIAQSCAALATRELRALRVHGRHLLVDGRKMSKRDGSFFTARDLLDPEAAGRPELARAAGGCGLCRWPGEPGGPALRAHRHAVRAADELHLRVLVQAHAGVERLQSLFARLREAEAAPGPAVDVEALAAPHVDEFDAALDDDLNMSRALAAVFRFASAINQAAPAGGAAAGRGHPRELRRRPRRPRSPGALGPGDPGGSRLAGRRCLRATSCPPASSTPPPSSEPWRCATPASAPATSPAPDAMREELRRRRVLVEDTPQGARWRRLD